MIVGPLLRAAGKGESACRWPYGSGSVWRVWPILMVFLSWGRISWSAPVPSKEEHEALLTLRPGWNLEQVPHFAERLYVEQLESLGVQVWVPPFGRSASEASQRFWVSTRVSGSEAWVPGTTYWFWSDRTVRVSLKGTASEASWDGIVTEGSAGVFVAPPGSGTTWSPQVKVLTWDSTEQGYDTRLPGERLELGTTYWVRPFEAGSSAHQVELYGREGDLVFVATSSTGEELVVERRRESEVALRPMPPAGFSAHLDVHRNAVLEWRAPNALSAGALLPEGIAVSYRVYRDDVRIADVAGETAYREPLPPGNKAYRYFVTALLTGASGEVLESQSSTIVDLVRPAVRPAPGEFEAPRAVKDGAYAARLPKTSLSFIDGKTWAHLVYVARGPGDTQDQLRYLRSARSGKPGSFAEAVVVARFSKGHQITDLALSSEGARVSVAWIERSSGSSASGFASRVVVRESRDAGAHFGELRVVDNKGAWKRGLDAAYDRHGDHHLIWGEDNKVYYLKNMRGSRSNVFDLLHRSPAPEARYKVYYPERNGVCPCQDCWCEESSLRGTKASSNQGRAEGEANAVGETVVASQAVGDADEVSDAALSLGADRFRLEENYVYEPSLYIDDDAITIIARQRRSWDDQPIKHDPWWVMVQDPVFEKPEQSVFRNGRRVRLVVGWGSVWKHAYEANDEAKWDSLGNAFQYRYHGTWHGEDAIRVAQRPLKAGAWSQANKEVKEVGSEPRAAGWKEGDLKKGTLQSWRISVVDDTFGVALDDRPSHPQVLRAPGGVMVAVYEKGPSSDPNVRGQNPIHVAYSDDGGLTWSPSRMISTGYMPRVAVTSSGELAVLHYAPSDPVSKVQIVRSTDLQHWGDPGLLNRDPPSRIHFRSHGEDADTLWNVPSLSAMDTFFLGAWVRASRGPTEQDHIVVTRASRETEFSHIDIHAPRVSRLGRNVGGSVTAENRFHMGLEAQRVETGEEARSGPDWSALGAQGAAAY